MVRRTGLIVAVVLVVAGRRLPPPAFLIWRQPRVGAGATPAPARRPPARRATPPPPPPPVTVAPEMTCPTPLGVGVNSQQAYCDVMSGTDPGERDSHSAAAAPGRRSILTFDLHNRHTYSEEQVRANRAFARYTATIGVLTMDNTLISRAVVQNEFRTSDGSGGQDWWRRRSRRLEGGRAHRNRAHLHRHSGTRRRRERPRREVERGAVGRQCELHVAGTADRGHQQRHDRVRSDAVTAGARPQPLGSLGPAHARPCCTGSPSRTRLCDNRWEMTDVEIRSVRAVSARHVDPSIVAAARNANVPRIAADLAVLNECASDVRLQIDLDLFTAIRTGDEVRIVHVKGPRSPGRPSRSERRRRRAG